MPADSAGDVADVLAAAKRVLREQYEPGRHHTGAAILMESGSIYTGVSLKARTGVADAHAEPIALARATLDGHHDPEMVAAVQPRDEQAWSDDGDGATRIVSACGQCRELLLAFAPDLRIVLGGENGPERHRLADVASGV